MKLQSSSKIWVFLLPPLILSAVSVAVLYLQIWLVRATPTELNVFRLDSLLLDASAPTVPRATLPLTAVKVPVLVAPCVGSKPQCSEMDLLLCQDIAKTLQRSGIVTLTDDATAFDWRVFFKCMTMASSINDNDELWDFVRAHEVAQNNMSVKLVEGFPGSYIYFNEKAYSCKLLNEAKTPIQDYSFHCFLDKKAGDRERMLKWCKENPKERSLFVKDSGQTGAKGIYFQNCNDISTDIEFSYAQEYLRHPLLLFRRKFDLRAYILITSLHPFRFYLSRTSVGHFAMAEWTGQMDDEHMDEHIANRIYASRHKSFNPNTKLLDDGRVSGQSITLEKILLNIEEQYSREDAIKTYRSMKQSIRSFLLPSLEALRKSTPVCRGCFALIGADLVVDSNFNAKVIETTFSNSMTHIGALSQGVGGDLHSLSLLQMLRVDPSLRYVSPGQLVSIGVDSACAAEVAETVNEVYYSGVFDPVMTVEDSSECTRHGYALAMPRMHSLITEAFRSDSWF